ncbi:helix-turn-helix transcriptional regulator [Mucilaginibacter rubeus]|uniref:Helix-turn-helix transcriptional regulator n=1 Tax=Mucilaginibacter rubeus TaxID=2027860 RepID=A0AAE6MHN4_9SPHI|nr:MULTISPECIES: helix-turn-helix transcriptional regulator [Mucilaginibacter]QEM03723.1 helix-turn-helix transcriptional regulator [Mucilaginibacter rubeus]QEM16334.1 helix-turn-helix transcriptional regulator [Mucilaginibacter gossypii]QTE40901.1 helix-turn-helix transcriptional regulator [Mucilaginibacter rubeus]QTE47504.1 helix-turn-helix transcriptional regulator [Mucilaginibacter rubeus]QTE58896.1 helix-turn-helix transcriptional regulator [Mucilaginibacter rubeus]
MEATGFNNDHIPNHKDSVGERIRIQREIKNYSQTYMSFMLEISQPAYSNIERGTTVLTVPRLYEIAEILEISIFVLMPPSKYGSGINLGRYLNTLFKLLKPHNKRLKGKHESALAKGIVYRDISKNLD